MPVLSLDIIATSQDTAPYTTVYPWVSGTGFGTKFTNPAPVLAGASDGVAITPGAPATIFYSLRVSPYVTAYTVDATGFTAVYASPYTPLTSQSNDIAITTAYSSNSVAVASQSSPYTYSVNQSWFGNAKYSNPDPALPGTTTGVAYSRTSKQIAFASNSSPFISAYDFSVGGGFGTKFSNPGTNLVTAGVKVKFI